MSEESSRLPRLARVGHAAHCKMCLRSLPSSQTEMDSSRLALAFYCLGTLDLLDMLKEKTSEYDRHLWGEWIWEQQTQGRYGTGFKPSSYMTPVHNPEHTEEYSEYDPPHLIMTYTALLSLSILRDDFSRLDRPGILKFLRECQESDGSFSTVPKARDSDLRMTYCAFAISSMLGDWSAVDVESAVAFIVACRTYEGGYGQSPFCEASGGPTYCALAALHLAPKIPSIPDPCLTPAERRNTIRWLVNNQDRSGGFRGRTEKDPDACYCFWCGASLQIIGAEDLVNVPSLASFLSQCQFKFGGISKAPREHPDPYHTYLSLAALSMYPPRDADSWKFDALDPLLNAKEDTSLWARQHIPSEKQDP